MARLNIADLVIRFRGENRQFVRSARQVRSETRRLREEMRREQQRLQVLRSRYLAAAGAVTALGAAFAAVVKRSAAMGAELLENSRLVGLSVETYQGLVRVFKADGLGLKQAQRALQRFNSVLDDALQGKAEGADVFRRLGIAPENINGVLDGLSKVQDRLVGLSRQEQLALGADLFGERGARAILPLVTGGDLEEQISYFNRILTTLTTEQAEKLKALEQSFTDLADQSGSAAAVAVANISDELKTMLDWLTRASAGFTRFRDTFGEEWRQGTQGFRDFLALLRGEGAQGFPRISPFGPTGFQAPPYQPPEPPEDSGTQGSGLSTIELEQRAAAMFEAERRALSHSLRDVFREITPEITRIAADPQRTAATFQLLRRSATAGAFREITGATGIIQADPARTAEALQMGLSTAERERQQDLRRAYEGSSDGAKALIDTVDGLGGSFGSLLRDIADTSDATRTLGDKLQDFVAGLLDTFASGFLDRQGNKLADFLLNRFFHEGGYAAPGLAVVGERGPELVDFRTPGRVYSADELSRAVSTGGSGAVNITFAPTITGVADPVVLDRVLRDAEQRFKNDVFRSLARDTNFVRGLL